MWRKHPLVRAGLGLGLAVVAALTVGAALLLGRGFWQDGHQAPRRLEGRVTSYSHNSQTGPLPGRFHFVGPANEGLDFELSDPVLDLLQAADPATPVRVVFSPNSNNLYSMQVGSQIYVQNQYEPNQFFQSWQLSALMFVGLAGLVGLVGLVYSGLNLFDWLWRPATTRGMLVARVEHTELKAESFSLLVSPFGVESSGRQRQFDLDRATFLTTDGADFVVVRHTRLFRYVRGVQPLAAADLPLDLREGLEVDAARQRLRYVCGWRRWVFLYSDPAVGVLLTALAGLALVACSLFAPDAPQVESARYSLVATLGLLLLTSAVYVLIRFRRKLLDIKSPRQLSVGPVLSKWRVTGTSQDNRRLIVVADGGLTAGKEGVRRFDISPTLYDQLQVGDIVEIEHTSRLHFICRLEVKGHQELSLV